MSVSIYVIHYGCIDTTMRGVLSLLPYDAHIVDNSLDNRGYGGGCNHAAAMSAADWLLFANNDIVAPPGMVDNMLCTADAVGADFLCPRVDYPSGQTVYCGGRVGLSGAAHGKTWPGKPFRTQLIYGGTMLARRRSFVSLGGFWKPYHMYCEDTDLTMRALDAGMSIWCDPRIIVVHEEKL